MESRHSEFFMKKTIQSLLKLLAVLAGKTLSRKPLPDSPKRILLLMCHWIGDTFWAMQIIPALRKRYPDAEILDAHPVKQDLPGSGVMVSRYQVHQG